VCVCVCVEADRSKDCCRVQSTVQILLNKVVIMTDTQLVTFLVHCVTLDNILRCTSLVTQIVIN